MASGVSLNLPHFGFPAKVTLALLCSKILMGRYQLTRTRLAFVRTPTELLRAHSVRRCDSRVKLKEVAYGAGQAVG